jgi:hypothetical protein
VTRCSSNAATDTQAFEFLDLAALIDDLDEAGHGIVMTMGKGGVGKTTIATAIAIALADRGHEVTLSTTDPAAHLTDTLSDHAPAGLHLERIDPEAETARYSAEVLNAANGLDAEGRALLAEDLRSPCTEEIAVFHAFARTVEQARERIVVLDTARPATRYCCSTPPRATSASSNEPTRTSPTPSASSPHAYATPISHESSWSPSPNRHPSTKPNDSRTICDAPTSSDTAG